MKRSWILPALLTLGCSLSANAAIDRNDVPSCTSSLPQELVNHSNERELFIVLDRTMAHSLHDNMKSEMYQQIKRFLEPGDAVQMVQFSSFYNDGYTNIAFQGKTDLPLAPEQRDHVRKSQLAKLDKCLKKQSVFFVNKIGQTLKDSFVAQETPTNTELIGTLSDIASQIVANSSAKRKVVLLVSDMLENSDITSFYGNGRIRTIDPQKELALVSQKSMFADFANADIYIIGTGVLPGGQSYVSTQKMKQLQTFWQGYFQQSNAKLLGMGRPMLLSQMK